MFIERARTVHGNKYDYSTCSVDDKGRPTIICPTHGAFTQTRAAHARGQGCPQCAYAARLASNKKRAIEAAKQFTSKANEVHNQAYSYDNVCYSTVHAKVSITCNTHGEFNQTPAAHLNGQGCPECANEKRAAVAESGGERAIANWFDRHNIAFERQKTFDGCRNQFALRYDFYVPSLNLLVEFDGQQHFEFVKRFHQTRERFDESQKRDQIKTEYAFNNGIELLRIKFSDEKNIEDILESSIIKRNH